MPKFHLFCIWNSFRLVLFIWFNLLIEAITSFARGLYMMSCRAFIFLCVNLLKLQQPQIIEFFMHTLLLGLQLILARAFFHIVCCNPLWYGEWLGKNDNRLGTLNNWPKQSAYYWSCFCIVFGWRKTILFTYDCEFDKGRS